MRKILYLRGDVRDVGSMKQCHLSLNVFMAVHDEAPVLIAGFVLAFPVALTRAPTIAREARRPTRGTPKEGSKAILVGINSIPLAAE